MATVTTQTSFTSGELDPRIRGRIDIQAYRQGAAKLINVIVQPGGGVTRRPGTALVREVSATYRLLDIELASGRLLVGLSDGLIWLRFADGTYQTLTAPWSAAQARAVRWARRSESLLMSHPDVESQQLIANSTGAWELRPFPFAATTGPTGTKLVRKPFMQFGDSEIALQPVLAGSAESAAIAAGVLVTVKSSAPLFKATHLNGRIKIKGKQLTINNVISSSVVTAMTDEALVDGYATVDWGEEAFSAARGWPIALALHQNRLVIGGSREAPNQIWMSHSGAYFDFDVGTGLDDEAIAFRLLGERYHRIVGMIANRHLQVFTSAGEWIVSGAPITPASVAVELQTTVGSPTTVYVPQIAVDGATLFIGSNRNELREYLYTDTEDAYQAADLAILCRHLLVEPVDIAFDTARRLLCIVRNDGVLITVTIDRNSNVAAWSQHNLAGPVTAVLATADGVNLVIQRAGRSFLQRLDGTLFLDQTLILTSAAPVTQWTGLDALVGNNVTITSNGAFIADAMLTSGTLRLDRALTRIECGLRYSHVIEAMPIAAGSNGLPLDCLYRTLSITARTYGSTILSLDAGNGLKRLTPDNPTGVADTRLAAHGWRRPLDGAPWRIEQNDPVRFTLLAVTYDVKVNN